MHRKSRIVYNDTANVLKSFKCTTIGVTANGATACIMICTLAVAKDGVTSISTSQTFLVPSWRTFEIREFNFNSGMLSASKKKNNV